MSVGKMFWRSQCGCYYVKVDGKMFRLSPDEASAKQRRDALLVEHGTRKPSVADVVTLYLDWAKQELAETTYQRRERPLRLLASDNLLMSLARQTPSGGSANTTPTPDPPLVRT